MQAVGRLGSYISKSVNTVSGPFHPFGGAVDIIVVEQPDGSYKCSPWYVKFGKFQGVLKTREKVVNICVNGVQADFHMYLDHKGEAFFLKEADVEEGSSMCFPPSSSGEDTDPGNKRPLKSKSCNYDRNGNDANMTRTNSRRAQLLGLVFGRRSVREEVIKEDENANASGVVRTESLERAEFAADLLDLKWSTNLASSRFTKDNGSRSSGVDISKDEKLQVDDRCNYKETNLISNSSYQDVNSTAVKENGEEMKCLTSEYVVETCTSIDSVREDINSLNSEVISDQLGLAKSDVNVSSLTIISEFVKSDSDIQDSGANLNNLPDTSFSLEENVADNIQSLEYLESSEMTVKESYPRSFSVHPSGESFKGFDSQSADNVSDSSNSTCPPIEEHSIYEEDAINKLGFSVGPLSYHQTSSTPSSIPASSNSEEEQLVFGNLDGFGPNESTHLDFMHEVKEVDEFNQEKCCSSFSLDKSIINDYINDDNLQGRRLRNISSDVCISRNGGAKSKELTRMVRSLPIMSPLSYNLQASDLGHSSDPSLYPDVESGANNDNPSSGALTMAEDVKKLEEGKDTLANQSIGHSLRSIDSLRRSRRGWPFSFRGSRSMKVSDVDMNGDENPISMNTAKNNGDFEGGKYAIKVKANKKIVKTLTPTSEQLASLNLKEGKNIVIFTFSTAMLGKQQVDARIFLWRWNTRIVISDVDGTITRSDLLGQVMPLVGMDWSQTGVAHLFSAIKENGYQLLFLSARSISQSFHTRQFLCNIKQDGKVLPDGPVVISPDGLFPSLFREVVRRAPHEFKIACLEDIKALFPADTNPFYAGFGNRDTDEFSYLKVGIPKGKIFTINPKGEIVVNRRVDTKSYLSLRTLVHGMFPSMSSSEQEDFNSWNYWKLPPPHIEL